LYSAGKTERPEVSELSRPLRGLFVTGIDTGVGKTHVTCLLARELQKRGLSVGIYKPVCSGADLSDPETPRWSDLERLSESLAKRYSGNWICPQRFQAPLAPFVAAQQEGKTVDAARLRTGLDVWKGQVDLVLVEGVGGWMCPLTEQMTIADLARDIGFPVLVVSANRLGMISQTLLTLQSITFSGLQPLAAVVNPVSAEDDGTWQSNSTMLRNLTDVPILGPLPWGSVPENESGEPVRNFVEACLSGMTGFPAGPDN